MIVELKLLLLREKSKLMKSSQSVDTSDEYVEVFSHFQNFYISKPPPKFLEVEHGLRDKF